MHPTHLYTRSNIYVYYITIAVHVSFSVFDYLPSLRLFRFNHIFETKKQKMLIQFFDN